MKNNSKKSVNINNDKIFNDIKAFIPESIVMNASAFMNKDAVSNTIKNMYNKVKNDYLRIHPNTNFDWKEYDIYIMEIIQMRILIK